MSHYSRPLPAARDLTNIVSPAGTFTYAYKGPGTLWTNLALPTSSARAIANGYDCSKRTTLDAPLRKMLLRIKSRISAFPLLDRRVLAAMRSAFFRFSGGAHSFQA